MGEVIRGSAAIKGTVGSESRRIFYEKQSCAGKGFVHSMDTVAVSASLAEPLQLHISTTNRRACDN